MLSMMQRQEAKPYTKIMAKIAKCGNCQQFDVEAKNESDKYCSRCQKAIEQGLTELPDQRKSSNKNDKARTDEGEKVTTATSN